MSVILNADEFTKNVIEEKKTALIDFYAVWCGPCKMMAPVVDAIAAEYEGKLFVGKINVDNDRAVAMEYDIMSIPTIILFKDGKEVDKNIGALSKEQLKAFVDKNL